MLNYKENPLVVEKREHLNFADAPGVGLVFPESMVGRGPSWAFFLGSDGHTIGRSISRGSYK